MAKSSAEVESVLSQIIAALNRIDPDERERVFRAVQAFFFSGPITGISGRAQELRSSAKPSSFSDERSMTPKEFLSLKQPKTDVERIACLAYYLTHYREKPHFRTSDLSELNTEAAQVKFANASYSAANAQSGGFLAAASKGNRQISAAGEAFVRALPDRNAARQVMSQARRRRATKRKKQKRQR